MKILRRKFRRLRPNCRVQPVHRKPTRNCSTRPVEKEDLTTEEEEDAICKNQPWPKASVLISLAQVMELLLLV